MEGDREQSALLAQTDILDRTGIHIRLTVVDGAEEAPICHIPINLSVSRIYRIGLCRWGARSTLHAGKCVYINR